MNAMAYSLRGALRVLALTATLAACAPAFAQGGALPRAGDYIVAVVSTESVTAVWAR